MSVVGSGFFFFYRLTFHAVHILTPLPHRWDFPRSLSIPATYASDECPGADRGFPFFFPLDLLLHSLFLAPIPALCLLPVFLSHLGFLRTVLVTMTSVAGEALLLPDCFSSVEILGRSAILNPIDWLGIHYIRYYVIYCVQVF